MNLEFKVSKTANFYFFVDNLSKWNIYYRKRYNEEWLKEFGKLNKKEKTALKHFGSLMQKYEKFGTPKKIRKCFYQKSDNFKKALKKTEKFLNKNEISILKNSFVILEPRFEKLWNTHSIDLNYNKTIVTSAYKKLSKKINTIYSTLENFYGDKTIKKYSCTVFLIISPNRGGKAISKNVISIETEKLDPKDEYRFTRLWFSIMHELSHSRFENKKYKNWLKKFIENKTIPKSNLLKTRNAKEVLREVITDLTKIALYPLLNKEGKAKIESLKNKKNLKKISDLHDLEILIRKELTPTVEKYFSIKRKIDINLLEKCWELIEKYS